MTPEYWPEAVAHLVANDPVVAAIVAQYPNETLVCRGDAFGTLARSIVGQQISVKAAASVWRRLEAALGGVRPAAVAATDTAALLACGLSRAKAGYLGALARHFLDGLAEPGRWAAMDDTAVIADLVAIKGIGRWTAEMFLIFNLMRPDVLPLDDIGLRRAMAGAYGLERVPEPAGMKAIAARWRPWRSVGTWYLWRSLDPLPVEY